MRILLVTAHFRPHVGGIERFVENLASGLADRGHEVAVLCARTTADAPLLENGAYRVIRVPASTLLHRLIGVPYPLPHPVRLWRALRDELQRADVVHVQDALYVTSVTALIGCRRAGVPSLLTQHVGFVPQGFRLLNAIERVALATLGRVARLATRTVALTDEVAAFAGEAWSLSDVTVLPVGVPAAATGNQLSERRLRGIHPDTFVALFVGRDVPKKGLDLVLGAADPRYEIIAVTDRRGPAPPGVTLLPFVAHDELLRLYAAADAFVLPSEGEGIPVALQEAAAAGLPLVVAFGAGYSGVLSADDVWAVERTSSSVRQALVELAHNNTLRARLGARARAAADRSFGYSAFVEAYERLYHSLTLD